MIGKDLKVLHQKLQSTAPLSFSPENSVLVTIYWAAILDDVFSKAWRNKTAAEAVALIPDNELMSPAVERLSTSILATRKQQSPFVTV